LRRAIDNRADDSGWANLGNVGQYLSSARADFDSRHYGHSKLINLVKTQDYLEVENEDGQPARIRLTSRNGAKKAARKRPAKKSPAKKAQASKAPARKAPAKKAQSKG
jgi:topoisomerase IA-like protein